ncbi:hypothetical protein tloyanaT_25890 [Thalassotalea loyana]|uniref:Uncharacterized protein n=1 Tax=Thalassotalea loyana TaxID=280483 RepID=A0ABQ6HE15_9GAMM|nr:hypothetical protein [Thalassotalea loyana]GLX86336.1 hypothetical protein tloyanaT_25890 [Thalassotalea loyana]
MPGETYHVYVGEELVACKKQQADATNIYWQECSRQHLRPVMLVKTEVLACNELAQSALKKTTGQQ